MADRQEKRTNQLRWPWTWHSVLKHVVDDVNGAQLWVVSFLFWLGLPKYGPHPMDVDLTMRHLEEAEDG